MILYSIWASPRNIHIRIPHVGSQVSGWSPTFLAFEEDYMCAPSITIDFILVVSS